MSKRCANIHKRKDERWEGRIKIGKYPNGSTKYRSIYGKTYNEVKEKMEVYKINKKPENIVTKSKPTFGKVLLMWFSSVKISIKKSTIFRYEYLINRHIIPALGEYPMEDITSNVINNFLDEKLNNGKLNKEGGLSPAYVKSMINIIKSAINYAVAEDLSLPMKTRINKPAEDKYKVSILSHNEQQKLKDYIDCNMNLTGLGIIISLYAGLRIGEICALSWNDIDFNTMVIHVRHTISRVKKDDEKSNCSSHLILDTPKTKSSERDIPISTVLMPYLSNAYKTAVSEFVVSEKEGFVSPRTFEYRYHKILKNCLSDNINYHALRHTFATRCVEAGVDTKTLSEILGHSNVSITLNTYVHSSMELKRKQLEKLTA